MKKIDLLHCLPIIFLWTLITGSQYNVGRDYFLYDEIYKNINKLNLYVIKKEYLFYYVNFLKIFTNNSCLFFYTTALI